ncbi:MAG: acyltransferase [Bacteroidetes bacterium]|nr:acyltransferase [Bacteroidota bacterium]
MFRKIYLSPLGFFISGILNALAFFHKPFMVYGFFNKVDGKFYKRTRISSTVKLVDKKKINIKDNVWIGHNSLLDGIGGIIIEKGVNIASHTCIYTHSSQNSIRLLGDKFIDIPASERIGYIIEGVKIGEFTFVGTACILLPGTTIGKGCIIGAGSVVKGVYPDYSILVGNPAKVVGDTRIVDGKLFEQGLSFENYYDATLIKDNKYTSGL